MYTVLHTAIDVPYQQTIHSYKKCMSVLLQYMYTPLHIDVFPRTSVDVFLALTDVTQQCV